MKRWLVVLQSILLMIVTWQGWSIQNCEDFTTLCEDCTGTIYSAGCGRWCYVGERLDDEAYTCCCSTSTRTGYNACCEGSCVRYDCEPDWLGCTYDVQFRGSREVISACRHNTEPRSRSMEGRCDQGDLCPSQSSETTPTE